MEPARVPLDPFGLTPDTAAYVPRPATERVIAELLEGLHHGAEPVALLGPAGSGKTLLLHLLAERARPALQGVYLPNPRLGPEELCTWVLRGLGAAVEEDPVWLLRAAVAHLRERDEGCLLLIDDADSLSDATAAWLGRFARESAGGLRVALAAPEGTGAQRMLAALGAARVVRLDEAMSLDETREYVAWRLRRAGASAETEAELDADAVARLYGVSGGNPRRLHLAAAALLRGGRVELVEDELDARAAKARRGTPPPPAPIAPRAPAPVPEPAPGPAPAPSAGTARAPAAAVRPTGSDARRTAPTGPPAHKPRHVRGALLAALALAAVAALLALARLRSG